MEFVNLYLESEYTLTSSPIKISELVTKLKEYNFNSVAITDSNNMYGVFKFYNSCTENNIKPIIGLQIDLVGISGEKTKLVLYAKNNTGYKNLLKISTLVKTEKELNILRLNEYTEGLLAIIPGEENELTKFLLENINADNFIEQYKNIFSDLYYGANMQTKLMQSNINKLISIFENFNIKSVAFDKICYLNKEDYEVYKVLNCIGSGNNDFIETEKEKNSFLLNKEEYINLYKDNLQLLINTNEIKDKCNVLISFEGYRMPVYDANIDTDLYLKELSVVGLKKRLELNAIDKKDYKKYAERLFYELEVIQKMGFSDYFLIVYDFIKYAKKRKILVGPGRGSAPGSLVAFSLGITEIDPLKFGLLFERFLNPERVSMPDIDTDFPDYNRDEVIKYMGEKYGKNKVAHIGTFGTFGPRLAVRDVARVMGLSSMYLDEVLIYIDNNVDSIEKALENKILYRMYEGNSSIKYLLDIAIKLQNLPRHVSIHAAGIIVADSELTDYTALQEGINGLYQTQFEASDLEKLGLVKIDFLGLKNLTIIDDVIKMIDDKDFDIDKISLDDKNVYKMLASQDTDGIFQLESSGMRNLLSQLKTNSFEDIYNALALYRPGPMEIIPSFIKRKFKLEPVKYLHNDLKDILESTYGAIVYQEQIILIAQKFAGYTLGQADILRRAVSKKKADLMAKEREKFISGAVKKGYSIDQAINIFDYILKFANYGFNKSHSVAYSLVSYRMAYLKRYYPKEFMAVLMSNNIGRNRLLKSYILSCNKYKVDVFCPNINISTNRFEVNEEGIYYSLLAITGLGDITISSFLKERMANGIYNNYDEFISRTKSIFNKKNIEMLIYSGALDCFKLTRKSMIEEYEKSIEIASFGGLFKDSLSNHNFSSEEYDFGTMSKLEREALGINIKYDIFKQFYNLKVKYKTTDLNKVIADKNYTILFTIDKYRIIKTKSGNEMAFLTISDDTETMEAVIFPNLYESIKNEIELDRICLGDVKVENRQEKLQCVFNKIIIKKNLNI